jgi:hypothetical protein
MFLSCATYIYHLLLWKNILFVIALLRYKYINPDTHVKLAFPYGYSEFFIRCQKYEIRNKMTPFRRQNAYSIMGTFFHDTYILHSRKRSFFVFKYFTFR